MDASVPRVPLSRLEHRVMRVLWRLGTATAEQVEKALRGRFKNATVRTLLRRVEAKGYAAHTVQGRTFVYAPAVPPEAAGRTAVARVVQRFYDGSMEQFLVGLVGDRLIDRAQLETLLREVKDAESRPGKKT